MLKLLIFSLFVPSFSQQTENNGTFGDRVNGDDLVKLGRQLQKPMLTIIGMALSNLNPCEQWTLWTSCTVRKQGYFGSRTRTRACNYNKNVGNEKVIENDDKLCEGYCPVDYNITKHGYCIKFYTEKAVNDDAVRQCRNDGGYLIESKQKHGDIKEILQGYNGYPYVGGKRKDVSSPWTYEYGKTTALLEFHPGQPSNKSSDLCLCLDRSTKL
ncbi:hypothetical protein ACF0H5_021944 [Mactra antiquata]